MINWFNMPDEGLSNGGLFEVKELEVTENGTYETKGEMYNKVTVNVEGGGGSSDFSTAEVTLINNYEGVEISLIAPTYVDSEEISTSINYITAQPNETITQNAFLYKNSCFAEIKGFEMLVDPEPLVTVSGNVVYEGDGFFTITGDCTITIS